MRIDYIALVDWATLEPVDDCRSRPLFAVAAWVGATRLIDNAISAWPTDKNFVASSASRGCNLESMPELPDITAYITALEPRILGQPLEQRAPGSRFLLRTVDPPLASRRGPHRPRTAAHRQTHRHRRRRRLLARAASDDRRPSALAAAAAKLAGTQRACALSTFRTGSLVLTEAGSKRRASLHVLRGEEALRVDRSRRHRDLLDRPRRLSRRAHA